MKFPKGFNLIKTPLPFQAKSIIYGIIKETPGLLLGVGLGKTMVAINIARFRIQFSGVDKVLILAPPSIMYNWSKEIGKFSEYESIILHGDRQEREYRLKYFKKDPNLRFGVINYEGLQPFLKDIRKVNINMIIADESARFLKNPFTGRTKATIFLGEYTKYRSILTATPIAHKPIDVWSQFRFLDRGRLFTDNFFRFRNTFFTRQKFPRYVQYTIDPKKITDMNKRIYSTCIRFTKKDVKEELKEFYGVDVLTEHAYQIIKIKMDISLGNLYESVKKHILAEIETLSGTARLSMTSVFTKLIRLQQITSGFTLKGNKVAYLMQRPKLEVLLEEVESIIDAEESCIIWCKFRHSMNFISKELEKKNILSYYMSGDDNPKEKEKKWRGFQQSDIVNVFIGQIKAGGIGIELFKLDSTESKSQTTIFYENEWALEVREQAEGRIDRIGQRSLCRYVDLIVEDTIDERILTSIRDGQEIANRILKQGVRGFLR